MERLIKKSHFIGQKSIAEQEPVRKDNSYQPRQERLKTNGTECNHPNKENNTKIDEVRGQQTSQTKTEKGVKGIRFTFLLLITAKELEESYHKCQRD